MPSVVSTSASPREEVLSLLKSQSTETHTKSPPRLASSSKPSEPERDSRKASQPSTT